ncbi:MAG TPA: DinB family protein [Thermoanaerobaculia bacterium]|nr:DinB family protein [Thermoanaerobaculia bacterium]
MGQRADPRASVGFEGEEFTRQLGGSYVNVKGETWPYPLHEMLVHVVNHSTYHRGQVATMLRQLGKTPLSTDYLVLLDGVPER